jgi:site-specific recombinase XerD
MNMNIKELHAEFCQEALVIKNYRPSTIRYYGVTIGQFLNFSHLKYLEDITTERIREFLYNGRLERKWTADTFLHYYKGLRAFLKWCVKREYILKNPIKELPPLAHQNSSKHPRFDA